MTEVRRSWKLFDIDEILTTQGRAVQILAGSEQVDDLISTLGRFWMLARGTGESLQQILGRKIAEKCAGGEKANLQQCLINEESKKAYDHRRKWQERMSSHSRTGRNLLSILNSIAELDNVLIGFGTDLNVMSAEHRNELRDLLQEITPQVYSEAEDKRKDMLIKILVGLRNVPPNLVDVVVEAHWAVGME